MFAQHMERGDRQSFLVGRLQNHERGHARVEGLLPARRAQAPAVAGLEARKRVLDPGGDQIVSDAG